MDYMDFDTLLERFSIMTVDGHLTDNEAFNYLKPKTTIPLFNNLQLKIWELKNKVYTNVDNKEDKMYTDAEIIELEEKVIKNLGCERHAKIRKKIVGFFNGYRVADYLIELNDVFPKKYDNVYWSNYIIKDGKVMQHHYQFDDVEKDVQKLEYELSLYIQNNKKVVI